MPPLGLFIAWPWQNAFLRNASDRAAANSRPTKAGIP
jgi:hypothetical protein